MCGPFFADRLCGLEVWSCDVQVDEGVALFDELASYRIGSLFGDVIISRSDDSLLGFEAGGTWLAEVEFIISASLFTAISPMYCFGTCTVERGGVM